MSIAPGWHGLLGTVHGFPGTQWISFLLFWALNILVINRGMDLVRRLERFAAPFVLVMTAVRMLSAWMPAQQGIAPWSKRDVRCISLRSEKTSPCFAASVRDVLRNSPGALLLTLMSSQGPLT